MPKVEVVCSWCGFHYTKQKRDLHEHNFCCRSHFHMWNGIRMAEYNRSENPMNRPDGWSEERKDRSRDQRLGTDIKSYRKFHQQHEHRVVAAETLGRPLMPGEVVHHIDGDKTNNSPGNLEVMTQSDHCRMHSREYWARKKVGDAE